MATVTVPVGSPFVISAANLYVLGNASGDTENGGLLIHIANDNTLSATITVKAQGLVATKNGVASYQAVSYRKGYLNGAVGDWSYVSTGITGESIIFVPGGGLTVALDTTGNYTSGSCTVYATPVLGAASL